VCLIIETLSDNKNRSVNKIRHCLAQNGGSLGVSNSVLWAFNQQSLFLFESDGRNEDHIMEDALEGGAEDVQFFVDEKLPPSQRTKIDVQVLCQREDLAKFQRHIESKGYKCTTAELVYTPTTTTDELSTEEKTQLTEILKILEQDDDVQEVYHNYSGEL